MLEELPVELPPAPLVVEPLVPLLPLVPALPLAAPPLDVEPPLPELPDVPVEPPADDDDPPLVPPELADEPSSVEEVNALSRNTTERMSVSIRRNSARATCERSISTCPSADDDQCICNAVYNAANSKLDNPNARTSSNSVKPRGE